MSTLKPTIPEQAAPMPIADVVLYIGTALLLVPQFFRATTNVTNYPDWDLSPLVYALRTPAMPPSGSILCDAVTMLGSACLLIFAALRRRAGEAGGQTHPVAAVLAALGVIGVLLHTHFATATSIGDLRVGASWVAAAAAGLAVFHAAGDAKARRLLTAVVIGFIVLLFLRGVQQVFIEHPQTLENFRDNKDRVLAAHGWSPGSPMALGFERRLSQPEASGWFGLSNVYSTFAAGTAVALLGLWLGVRNQKMDARGITITLGAAMLAAIGCVALAGGKGGVLATALGAIAVGAFVLAARVRPLLGLARSLPVLAILGAFTMIVARGLVGERIGELSILFRWFYVQAATRIFVDRPLQGVGPDGFQTAFLTAKPPLCPEEVTSPHSIFFDWISTLGVLGFAWVVLLLAGAWMIGRSVLNSPDEPAPANRGEIRAAMAVPALATIVVTWFESPLIVPELAAVRVLGLVGWCVLAYCVMRSWNDRFARIGLAAAGAAMLAHAQIEVSASYVVSAPLWAIFIALAASGATRAHTPSERPDRRMGAMSFTLALAAAVGALSAAFAFPALTRVRGWEDKMRDAADLVRTIPAFGERLQSLGSPSGTTPYSAERETPETIASDLTRRLGHTVPATNNGLSSAMRELEDSCSDGAARLLGEAFEFDRTDRRPLRDASMLLIRKAGRSFQESRPNTAKSQFEAAIGVMQPADAPPAKAGDWLWIAMLHQTAAEATRDADSFESAIAARTQAAGLDPYNLPNAVALAKLFARAGKPKDAATWARRALELDDLSRLDRSVRGLTAPEAEMMRELAKETPSTAAPPKPSP